jgi:hypothetical protein
MHSSTPGSIGSFHHCIAGPPPSRAADRSHSSESPASAASAAPCTPQSPPRRRRPPPCPPLHHLHHLHHRHHRHAASASSLMLMKCRGSCLLARRRSAGGSSRRAQALGVAANGCTLLRTGASSIRSRRRAMRPASRLAWMRHPAIRRAWAGPRPQPPKMTRRLPRTRFSCSVLKSA